MGRDARSADVVLHTALAGRHLFVVATEDLEREEFSWFVKTESVNVPRAGGLRMVRARALHGKYVFIVFKTE